MSVMGGDHFLNLQPGTIVNGRYEVVKCLGTGSMGMVYACRHRELAGHIVAMKVLFAEVARDEVAAARFRNEIVASYGVSHPNVVRAYEYFRDGDLAAFTMEYIGGGDLADRISDEEEIPINEIITMLSQMASGVQAIHDAGIIHRDLKPENILITSQGDIKITDFGIARTGTGPKLTEHGGVVGTIDYVSPEYLEQGQVDRRSDIYALGILAYEMVTSSLPFKGKSLIETMTLRLRTDPEPPHHLRTDCPVALSNIVLKAMAREPEERYQQARELSEDIDNLKHSLGITHGSSSSHKIMRDPTQQPKTGSLSQEKQSSEEDDDEVIEELPPLLDPRPEEREINYGAGSPMSFPRKEEFPSSKDLFAVRPDIEEHAGGTLQLGSAEVETVQESIFSTSEAPSFSDVFANLDSQTEDESAPHANSLSQPKVAVSQSRLSAERMSELSRDVYQPASSMMKTVSSWIFLFLVGFGVGWLLLLQLVPELFDSSPIQDETVGYVAAE